MHIDVDKCADGCTACVDACNEENGLTGFGRPETDSQWIRKIKIKDKTTEKITTMPMPVSYTHLTLPTTGRV